MPLFPPGLAIGSPVTGGAANDVLVVDGTGHLAQKARPFLPTFEFDAYDDFSRDNTSPGNIGSAVVGGPWDLRIAAGGAAGVGYISNNRFVTNPGEVVYAIQTLPGICSRIGAVISWGAGTSGTNYGTAAFLIPLATTGTAFRQNDGIHVTVTRVGWAIQYILNFSVITVEAKNFPALLPLNTSYVVDIQVSGSEVNYSICGTKGVAINKLISSAGLGPYALIEHYYAGTPTADTIRFEKFWASCASPVRSDLSELCVAAWKFEDTGWVDSSGQGHTLTPTNSPTVGAGVIGGGVNLSLASSQYLSVSSTPDLVMTGKDFAISCWVKLNSNPSYGSYYPIFAKDAGGTTVEYVLDIDFPAPATIRWRVCPNGNSASAVFVQSTVVPTPSVWVHIFVNYDAVAGYIGLSVNNETLITAPLSTIFSGTGPFKIGYSQWLGAYADCQVDELYVFTSAPGQGGALDPNRRTALYYAGRYPTSAITSIPLDIPVTGGSIGLVYYGGPYGATPTLHQSPNFYFNDAVNILAIGTTPSCLGGLQIANSYTNSSFFERANFNWTNYPNILTFGTESVGGAPARPIRIFSEGICSLFGDRTNTNSFAGGAGNFTATGPNNAGLGISALGNLTSGNANMALGHFSGLSLTSAVNCLSIGSSSLQTATTCSNVVALGTYACLGYLDTPGSLVAIGTETLKLCQYGAQNIAIGPFSGRSVNYSYGNTFIGDSAGFNSGYGSSNTIIGAAAGYNLTGTDNSTLVGMWKGPASYISGVIALSTGDTNLRMDYNYTNAATWTTAAPIVVTPVAVASLPAAGIVGRRHFVTDATVTTFASAVVGGGTNKIPVYDDGTTWRIG